MSSDDSDHEAGGVDFAAIDSQAHVNLSMEEANKLHRQKLMGTHQTSVPSNHNGRAAGRVNACS
jgi:hypothetical protein